MCNCFPHAPRKKRKREKQTRDIDRGRGCWGKRLKDKEATRSRGVENRVETADKGEKNRERQKHTDRPGERVLEKSEGGTSKEKQRRSESAREDEREKRKRETDRRRGNKCARKKNQRGARKEKQRREGSDRRGATTVIYNALSGVRRNAE